ncbi:hypothetical protein Cva_01743 [Caedimonas varicaedens]|uniref:Uncharacterized protein n=1 Tax=Caedimonas varicaedens TaxID=1629334 RepID=A0A0K8MFU4_9PROT|nr:hypothetical protein Cva_01743 [Caedimonas varicaedens]
MSYGQNAPQGFQSQGTQTAATFTGQTHMYAIKTGYATSIFTGDPVILDGGYLKHLTDGTASTTLATMPIGIFQGCQWNSPDVNIQGLAKSPYWPANTVVQPFGGITSAYAWVITDSNATWNIQVSTSADDVAATATVKPEQIGQYATWKLRKQGNKLIPANPGTGNTATGQSGVYLDATTIKADPVGLPLVILGFTLMPGNKPGMPFCNVIVGWNPKIVKPAA